MPIWMRCLYLKELTFLLHQRLPGISRRRYSAVTFDAKGRLALSGTGKALVIDERFNSGGQIPDRFIEILDRKPLAFSRIAQNASGFLSRISMNLSGICPPVEALINNQGQVKNSLH